MDRIRHGVLTPPIPCDYPDCWICKKEGSRMTEQEVVREMCRIGSLVYHSIGNYNEPADGFCDLCPNHGKASFRSTGKVIDYIRKAVVNQLILDGHHITRGFDPETGKEIHRDTTR